MDEDTAQLVRHLSTRAGILMEDVSAHAILTGKLDARGIADVARKIKLAGEDAAALGLTMLVLLGCQNQTDEDVRMK